MIGQLLEVDEILTSKIHRLLVRLQRTNSGLTVLERTNANLE